MTEPPEKSRPRMTAAMPLRMTEEQKALVERAALQSGRTMNDIMRAGGIAEARRVLRSLREHEPTKGCE